VAQLWNGLLDGLGAMLSFFYDVVPSYGFAILLLTITVRLVLLPLTIKQTRSMHAMQKIQPQIKELQRRYKGDRQKLNEEMMKLYKEHQVNPLGGCLPLLLQLPVFFALFLVLTRPALEEAALPGTRHLPDDSRLATDIRAREANFLSMNLACSPARAGRGFVEVVEKSPPINCGDGFPSALPYYSLVLLLVGTTWYQTKQMQATTQQQQGQMKIMTRVMPLFLGFISLNIASGVAVYWVTTNAWQIGQQYLMLRSRVSGDALAGKDTKRQPAGSGDGQTDRMQLSASGNPEGAEAQVQPPVGKNPNQRRRRGRRARSRKKRGKR
jgi:YidC/Oxa1 family membrane protein insertase